MKNKKLSWKQIDTYCDKLAKQITDVNYRIDSIISIGRGGMIPARILADRLSIQSIYVMNVTLYNMHRTDTSTLKILPFNHNIEKQHILLIDDIIDSGVTLTASMDEISKRRISGMRTACLLCKETVTRKPTFYADEAKTDQWIVFPWEQSEFKGMK